MKEVIDLSVILALLVAAFIIYRLYRMKQMVWSEDFFVGLAILCTVYVLLDFIAYSIALFFGDIHMFYLIDRLRDGYGYAIVLSAIVAGAIYTIRKDSRSLLFFGAVLVVMLIRATYGHYKASHAFFIFDYLKFYWIPVLIALAIFGLKKEHKLPQRRILPSVGAGFAGWLAIALLLAVIGLIDPFHDGGGFGFDIRNATTYFIWLIPLAFVLFADASARVPGLVLFNVFTLGLAAFSLNQNFSGSTTANTADYTPTDSTNFSVPDSVTPDLSQTSVPDSTQMTAPDLSQNMASPSTVNITDGSGQPLGNIQTGSDGTTTFTNAARGYAGMMFPSGDLLDSLNMPGGHIDNGTIFNVANQPIYHIDHNTIYNSLNQIVYTIENNTLYDLHHQVVAKFGK